VEAYGNTGRLIDNCQHIGPVSAPPADTVRYRKSPFHSDDEITVIEKRTEAGLSCEATERNSVSPAVLSGMLSDNIPNVGYLRAR
jgi:hypothetical protein